MASQHALVSKNKKPHRSPKEGFRASQNSVNAGLPLEPVIRSVLAAIRQECVAREEIPLHVARFSCLSGVCVQFET